MKTDKKIKSKQAIIELGEFIGDVNNIKVEPNCQIISESYYTTFSSKVAHEIYFKIGQIIYKATIQKDPSFRIDCNVRIERRDLISQEYKFLFDETYNVDNILVANNPFGIDT